MVNYVELCGNEHQFLYHAVPESRSYEPHLGIRPGQLRDPILNLSLVKQSVEHSHKANGVSHVLSKMLTTLSVHFVY